MNFEDCIEISVSCYSTYQNARLGCGVRYKNDGQPINLDDTDWIWSGLAECFWENYYEFEEGIAEARAAVDSGKKSTLYEALHEVFGAFNAEYTVNGETVALEYGVDVEEIIYNLLIENSDI